MPDYQRILFATDLSELSQGAAQKAAAFAERCGATIDFFHVVEPVSPAPYRVISSLNIEEHHKEVAKKQLDALVKSLPKGVVGKVEIKFGLPKHELMELAKAQKNDLMIVNDHGCRGIDRLLGSTANAAVNKAPCDVLVFRCRKDQPLNPSMYQHLLYSTDLSPASLAASSEARQLSETFKAKLSIIHVTESLHSIAYSYIGGVDVDIDHEMGKESREQVAKLGAELGVATEDCYIKVGNAKSEILDLAKETKVDLIVMSSHGHSGLGRLIGSTTNAVLNSAGADVLIVRQLD